MNKAGQFAALAFGVVLVAAAFPVAVILLVWRFASVLADRMIVWFKGV